MFVMRDIRFVRASFCLLLYSNHRCRFNDATHKLARQATKHCVAGVHEGSRDPHVSPWRRSVSPATRPKKPAASTYRRFLSAKSAFLISFSSCVVSTGPLVEVGGPPTAWGGASASRNEPADVSIPDSSGGSSRHRLTRYEIIHYAPTVARCVDSKLSNVCAYTAAPDRSTAHEDGKSTPQNDLDLAKFRICTISRKPGKTGAGVPISAACSSRCPRPSAHALPLSYATPFAGVRLDCRRLRGRLVARVRACVTLWLTRASRSVGLFGGGKKGATAALKMGDNAAALPVYTKPLQTDTGSTLSLSSFEGKPLVVRKRRTPCASPLTSSTLRRRRAAQAFFYPQARVCSTSMAL